MQRMHMSRKLNRGGLQGSEAEEVFLDERFGGLVTDFLPVRQYGRILYRRRWLAAIVVTLGISCAAVYNARAPRIFAARATIQIEADPNVLALDRPVVDQRDWMREFLPTQLGILMSRELARGAQGNLKSAQSDQSQEGSAARVPSVDEILMSRGVDLVKDTHLVNISFQSGDPALAARAANALAKAYLQRTLEFRSTTTGEASDWLTQQVAEQRKLVEASEGALQRYREEHGANALFADRLGSERQNFVVQQLTDLQANATKARSDTIEKEALSKQLAAIEAAGEPLDTLPMIASNPFIQSLKAELTLQQRQLLQASKELGERHPDIIKLREAVQNAERRLQSETSTLVHTIRNDYQAAQTREASLISALNRQKAAVQALNSKSVEYTTLEREATSNRDVLDKLLQRSREAGLARQLQTTNVRIVDSAEIPRWPMYPRQNRNLLVALVGSGAFALVLIFGLELVNVRMTSLDDVKRHLRIPVLGVTPQVSSRNGHSSLLLSDGVPPQFAELLHAVRTNLLMAPELAESRTVLVTSSEPGEGKTVTAANVAVSLARLNQRVLLIDGDLRKPQMHELFGVQQEPGLADVLRGTATTSALRKTKVPRLWLMPSGGASRNPSDLLGSERFRKLMDLLGSQFDWVIVDSPPVLAVTDPCQIARTTSGVLFVVGCGQTSPDVARAAVERIDAAGGRLVGAMLNRAVLDGSTDSYLPYYHQDYQTYYAREQGSSWLPELPDALSAAESTRGSGSEVRS
jgi:succinoglycan biosynthesis transport protein ExoP